MEEKRKTFTQMLEEVANDICSNYCKYPHEYTEEEWEDIALSDDCPCNNCPLVDLL